MTKIEKPWGYYEILSEAKEYIVKKIVIKPKQLISLQKHLHRDELWHIIKGMGKATLENSYTYLYSEFKDYLFIPCGELHRLENESEDEDLVIIEIQTGDKLDEDDIIRFTDNYGRVAKLVKEDTVGQSNTNETVTDGYATWLKKCSKCGRNSIEVIRIGKVQCSYCGY